MAAFARIARPLYAVIKKNAKFDWTDECSHAFLHSRKTLTEAPVLCIYNPKLETELHTDACSRGFGGSIVRRQIGDGKFHSVPHRPSPITIVMS